MQDKISKADTIFKKKIQNYLPSYIPTNNKYSIIEIIIIELHSKETIFSLKI